MKNGVLVLAFLIFALGSVFSANPQITGFVLDSGANYTSSATVAADLHVTWNDCNANQMMAFNCSDTPPGSFIAYAEDYSLNWSSVGCAPENGQKTIYAWVQCDANAETISASANDSITFDNTIPVIVITNNGTTQTNQTIQFTLSDNLSSGINPSTIAVKINSQPLTVFNSSNCSTSDGGLNYSCSYNETAALLQDGTYPVEITAKDNAANQATQSGSFTYDDIAAPAAPAVGSCSSASGSVSLSWAKNSEADMHQYNIYRNTVIPDKTSPIVKTVPQCATGCAVTDTNNISNGTTYFYGIAAVDKSGNESALTLVGGSGCTPSVPSISGTPTISSSTHSEDAWTVSDDPQFSWSSVTGGTIITYYYVLNTTESDPSASTAGWDSSTTSTSVSFSDRDNGTYWFHVRAYNGTNWSDADHYKIKIDDSSPSTPSNFSVAVKSNNYIQAVWDEPSDSGGSGLDYCYIVRALEGDSLDKSNYDERFNVSDPGDEFYDDDDVSSNKTYCYRMYCFDNAGNQSDLTSSDCADFKKDNITITINAPDTVKAGKMDFTVTSTGTTMKSCEVMIKKAQDSDFEYIGSSFTNTSSISRSYTFGEEDHGIAELRVECDNGTKLKNIKVDTSDPTVSWVKPSSGETVNGSVELIAEARDVSYGLKDVAFYDGTSLISETSSAFETNKFRVYWNAAALSGTHTLKVVAEDKAGNTAEAQVSVVVKKQEEPADTKAQAAISAAESAKTGAQAKALEFTSKGLSVPASMDSLKKEADALLVSAKSFLAQKEYANAEKNANSAKEKYAKIVSDYSIAEFYSNEIKYSSIEAGAFDGILFTGGLAGEAAANLKDANAARKILVFRTMDGSTEKYLIAVELVFTNKTDGNMVQIAEVIPKGLAKSSDEISSLLPFTVLVSDPVIK
ncbi:MAG: hypothetical protein NT067_00845, partial [Candidatus Diapherotrites archaeon]|nr:hypothetical protein [Candidatus Diapherotrites archaeon]